MARACSAEAPAGVGLLEKARGPLQIEGPLAKSLRVPFAARRAEEVAAIDLEGTGDPRQRIRHGVDDVAPERLGVLGADRLGARGLDPRSLLDRDPAPAHVVLTPHVDVDHSPHPVIVGHLRHVRTPMKVVDGEVNIFWRRIAVEEGTRVEAAGAKTICAKDTEPLGRDIVHSVTNTPPRITGALQV